MKRDEDLIILRPTKCMLRCFRANKVKCARKFALRDKKQKELPITTLVLNFDVDFDFFLCPFKLTKNKCRYSTTKFDAGMPALIQRFRRRLQQHSDLVKTWFISKYDNKGG